MTQAPPDPNTLLAGSEFKGRSVKFGGRDAEPPIWRRGMVVNAMPSTVQERNLDGELLFWDENGGGKTTRPTSQPVWNIVIPVQTAQRDNPDVIELYGEDDGRRFLWINGSPKPEHGQLWGALVDAMRKSKIQRIVPGISIDAGYVAVEKLSGGKTKKRYEMLLKPAPEGYVPPGMDEGSGNGAVSTTKTAETAEDPWGDEPPF